VITVSTDSPVSAADLDAAIVYGASRYLRYCGRYDTAAAYKEYDDQLLFYEFLHGVLLYERFSSMTAASPK